MPSVQKLALLFVFVLGRSFALLRASFLEARTAQLHLGQDAALGEDAPAAMTAEVLSLRQ